MSPRLDAPMLLEPILLEKVWGGDRLARFPGKSIAPGRHIGESWEASGLFGHDNRVISGPGLGCGLATLAADPSNGLASAEFSCFPFLLKIIDAREQLSLQVHPRDSDGGAGKAEAWYVLQGGTIVLGLASGVQLSVFADLLASGGDPTPMLATHTVSPGDVVPVPPGTLHAIGAGVMVVEVQQPADITYRVHDWGRTGRELHIAQALEVLARGPAHPACGSTGLSGNRAEPGEDESRADAAQRGPAIAPAPLEWREGENLHRFHAGCRHFALETAILRAPAAWPRVTGEVEALLCLEGRFRIAATGSDAPPLEAGPGQTFLIPAACKEVWIEPLEPSTLLNCYPCRSEARILDRMRLRGHAGDSVAARIFPA